MADTSESRVLEFDKPLTTDTAADRVFGQADSLEAAQCNFGNTNAPAAATLCSPTGVALDSAGDLLVADNANNRLLRFDQPLVAAPTPSPTPTPGHTPTPTPVSTPTPAFAGTLSVTTPELFGAVGIGAAKTELLAVHNVSPHKTMIVSLGALGAPFAVLSGFGPFEIAPLHKTTVTLQFAPTRSAKRPALWTSPVPIRLCPTIPSKSRSPDAESRARSRFRPALDSARSESASRLDRRHSRSKTPVSGR